MAPDNLHYGALNTQIAMLQIITNILKENQNDEFLFTFELWRVSRERVVLSFRSQQL